MDFEVPLNRLIFGQEDGAGINARVTGRQDGIAELAANIHANGQIENLVVKLHGPDNGAPVPEGYKGPLDVFAVSNGNRRLAAFRMIHSEASTHLVRVTSHDVDENTAFEHSLATAVTAKQLHPVDQYEAFVRLEERGKTNEEIARQYGMTEKEVRQVLALGRLSPTIRGAWRAGDIKAEVAQTFTLAVDHKTQDRLYKKLAKENDLDRDSIRAELGVKNQDIGPLVNFVGIAAYQDRGGHVTEDLFKQQHIVSDDVLLKAMVGERLQSECDALVAQGWAWAAIGDDLPSSWRRWDKTRVDVSKFFTPEESALAKQLEKREQELEDDPDYDWEATEAVQQEIAALEATVTPRTFTDKQKSKLGCVVDLDNDGTLTIEFGVARPAAVSKAAATAMEPTAGAPPEIKAPAKGKAAEPDLSQALIERLSRQLTVAAQTALIQEQDLAISVLLANFASSGHCEGIRASVSGLGFAKLDLLGGKKFADNLELALALKPADRLALLVLVAGGALDFQRFSSNDDVLMKGNPGLICNTIKPAAMNAALRGAFDAKDYFNSVPKVLCLIAIKEAIGADAARQQEKKKGPEIAAFAIANVTATGWLPPQLRAKGYDGPPKAKVLAMAPKGKANPPAKKPAAKAKPAPKGKATVKRAAASKKSAKKTSAKK